MSIKDNKQEMRQIDLTKLNLPQLSQLRKQLDQASSASSFYIL